MSGHRPYCQASGGVITRAPKGWDVHRNLPNTVLDVSVWPAGRYEVYLNDEPDAERINGFHTEEEARLCAEAFPGSVVFDRASRQ